MAHYFTSGPITSSTKSEKITKTKNRVGRTNPLIVDQQLSPRILGEVHLKIAFWSSDVFPLCPPTKEVHYLKSHFFSPFSAIITFSWQPLEDKNIGRTNFFKEHIMNSNFHFQLHFHFFLQTLLNCLTYENKNIFGICQRMLRSYNLSGFHLGIEQEIKKSRQNMLRVDFSSVFSSNFSHCTWQCTWKDKDWHWKAILVILASLANPN